MLPATLHSSASRLTHVTDWASRQTDYGYDALHRQTGISYPNAASATFAWDAASRLTGVQHHNGDSNFVDRSYTLDLHGNISAMTVNAGLLPQITAQMKRLQQNPADELTSIQTKANPGVQDWNTVSASHDLEGNLTGDGNLTFAYDYENRLVDVTGTGTQVSSSYAGDGGRVARSSSGETRIHVLDHGVGLHPVLMEVGTNGVPVRYYIWAGVLAAHVDAGGDVRFYHADHQGSTLALTDENGTVTDQWFHDPYGETLNRAGTTDTPYQWVGGYAVWNEGQGLYRMQARHYHSGLKRFTATDPLGVQELLGRGGLANLYQYANNSPMVYVDPDGEWAHIVIGAVIGGAAGAIGGWRASGGDWRAAVAGGAGGAAGGAFVASGAGIVAGALKVGTITAGKAVGSMTVIGSSGGVTGNTVSQVAHNRLSGQSYTESFANVDSRHQLYAGAVGAGAGLVGGGAIVATHAMNVQASAVNQILSRNITDYSRASYQAGASQATVNRIQDALVSGMYHNSFNAANMGAAISAANYAVGGVGEYVGSAGSYAFPTVGPRK